jgi:hypothetical protein
VEGSAPTKMEKEIAHGVGARNIGAPASWDSLAPLKKMGGDAPGLAETLSGSRLYTNRLFGTNSLKEGAM